MYAILSALHPQNKDPQRLSKYKEYIKNLIFDGIQFPINIEDMPKFEKNNDIKVNIFEYDEIIKIKRFTENENAIDLLYILGHYCWIKNLLRLVSSHINSHGNRKYIYVDFV